jgi:hypothetical protein
MLPPLDRLPGVMRLVEEGNYFVLHAPRQSGKTTAIQALAGAVGAAGKMHALYFSLEAAQPFTEPSASIAEIVRQMRSDLLEDPLFRNLARTAGEEGDLLDLRRLLVLLAKASPKPLAVFFDEVDALADGTLIAFLRQLRNGFVQRSAIPFPASVALVGMRNIRDYKAQVRPASQTLGSASPFNIITAALTLATFTEEDIRALYAQHTAATGQAFTDDAVAAAFSLTRGQPWLVNALARECVEKIHAFRYSEPITAADMETAKETLIRNRPIHLDYLLWMAQSEACQTATCAVLAGQPVAACRDNNGFSLLKELGLVSETDGKIAFTNPLYAEAFATYCPQTPNVHNCPKIQI